MDTEKQAVLVRLYIQMRQATDFLHTQAQEVYEMAIEIEELTKDTTISYATLKVRVEARAAYRAGYGSPPSAGGDGCGDEGRGVKGLEPPQRRECV